MTSCSRVALLFIAILALCLLLSGRAATAADGPPAAPTHLVWKGGFIGGPPLQLYWEDNSDNETGFKVLRSVGGHPPEVWAVLPADSTSTPTPWGSFEDQCAGIRITVVAFNDAGESAPSNEELLPHPRFGCPFPITFEKGPGQPAVALAFGFEFGIVDAELVWNAFGCAEPEVSLSFALWPEPCVDTGESVMVQFVANGPLFLPEPRWVTVGSGDADCDGYIESVDALFILRDAAAIDPLSACGRLVGDADLDGDVDTVDAHRVLATVAGLGTTA